MSDSSMRGRRARLIALAMMAACLAPFGAPELRAQAPEAPDQERDEDRWETVLDLAFSSASGNERVTLFASELRITHLVEQDFELETGARARYGRSSGETVAKNYRLGVNLAMTPAQRWSPFVFSTAEHDPLKRLDLRAQGGGGARYRFWEGDAGQASISWALLYSYEDFGGSSFEGIDPQLQRNARMSWRFKGHHSPLEGVRFEQVTFYQPIWDTLGDYLIEARTGARVLLHSRVGLTVSHTFERDATPPPEVRPDDHLVQVGLTLQL